MAENFGSQFSDAFASQQKIGIAERAQQFQEDADRKAEAEKHIGQLLTVASNITKAASDAGKDPMSIAGSIQPLIETAASVAGNVYGPDGVARVQSIGKALLARVPTGVNGQAISSAPQPVPAQQLSQADVLTPAQVSAANPAPAAPVASPNDGVAADASALPAGAAPVQSALPPAVGVGNMTPEAVDIAAHQLLKGNERVLMGLGYGNKGQEIRAAIRNRAAQIAGFQNLSPDEINQNVADFTGMKTGAQALGRREAGVTGAILGATKTLPRVLDASEAVNRTDYPDLNKILLAAKTRTGDEKVVRYGIAVNTYINNYARALGAGNAVLTDTARKEASDILQQAWSKGQIRAALNQMQLELESELQGAHEARKSFISGQQLRQQGTQDLTNNPPSGQQDIQKLKEKYGLK